MKLTTIADLKAVKTLQPFVEMVQGLGDHYLQFISQDSGGFRFEVEAGAEKDRKPGIHASEMSCARRMVYSIAAVERRPDPTSTDANMRMRMRLGQAVHAMLQNELIRMCQWAPYVSPNGQRYDLTFVPETRISPALGGPAEDHGIESSSDGIFTFWQNGEAVFRMILEIKTASDKDYEKTNAPKPEHVEQTHLYMACLDVPFTWILYYNKSNSNFSKPYAPFFFRFSEKLWSSLESRFIVNAHRAAIQQLPERSESIACRWCPFSYECKPSILTKYAAPQVHSSASLVRHLGRRSP